MGIDLHDGNTKTGSLTERPAPSVQLTPRSNSGGGLGCALVGLVIVVVLGLVGVALFLPPFSLGDRLLGTPFAPLNLQAQNQTLSGLTVALDPNNPARQRLRTE